MPDKFITSLYNRKQFLIASMIGGLIMTSSVIGLNLWAQNKNRPAIITIILGIILEILLAVIGFVIFFNLLEFPNNSILKFNE